MKKTFAISALYTSISCLALLPAVGSAAIITYDQRAITDYSVLPNDAGNYQGSNPLSTTSSPDYSAVWAAQNSQITQSTLTSTSSISENNFSVEELSISFSAASTESLGFQFALDAGFGGALYLDGKEIAYNAKDMWWAYNWNNSSQILASTQTINAGDHTLIAYWSENCCSGSGAARVSINDSNYQDLSVLSSPIGGANNVQSIPEPTTWAMLASGLLILVTLHRKTLQLS
ncbi:CCXG family PEP-CTERM protein [Methylomonas sp. AM2-LC]|uniref:CCXG family PEP-CTERM protein n=1 Tax=Methylomonas sp. AM2-LC TaxID=3153301 RepID=UPI0032662DCC